MTSSVLAGLLARKPFRPFAFHIGDDTLVHVWSPEQVLCEAPGFPGRIVTVRSRDGLNEDIIDLERVALIAVVIEKRS